LDDPSSYRYLAFFGMILLHAGIVLAHSALDACRTSLLRERAEKGDERAQSALRILDLPQQLDTSIRLALLLIKFTLAALGYSALVAPLLQTRDSSDPIALAGLLLVGLAVFLVAELLPRLIGRAYADSLVTRVVFLARLVMAVCAPLTFGLGHLEKMLMRPHEPDDEETKNTLEEEIIDLVESGQGEDAFEDDERQMIRSVLEFDETMVREIMVPRPDITAVEIDETLREALRLFIESGHSRIPVYEDEIDDIKGVLYAKDLLAVWYKGEDASIRSLMRQAHFVPETKRAEDLFRELQNSNVHLAVVVDEYGSVAGVITVEDIVEEIVGDIRDEYDATEILEFVQEAENEYTVDASINLYDLNQLLDTDLPDKAGDSLGGFLYEHFGRVPEIGERLETHGLILRIVSVEGVRIRSVNVTKRTTQTQDPAPQENSPKVTAPLQPRTTET
jgi:CBS domain containing-hemolysin-like protein